MSLLDYSSIRLWHLISNTQNKMTEINTTITIIIITAANDIGNNPLKLQVYLKPLLMNKLIDIVKKNIPNV